MKKFSELITEGNPLARTFTLKKKGLHSAFISAERKNRSAEQNAAAAKHLEKRVRNAGYGYRHTEGEYDEGGGMAKEKSYQVVARKPGKKESGKFRHFIRKLGTELDQQTILHNKPVGKRRSGEGTAIATTDHMSGGEPMKKGQRVTYGNMHYNTPNPYGITRFKKGGSVTYK